MDFENLDEIIDYAIGNEIEAAKFYEECAEKESFAAAAKILKSFAEEEHKHKKMLEKFKTGEIDESIKNYKFTWITDIKRSDYLVDMEYKPGMNYSDLLLLAMKREEKALKLYNELQVKVDNPDAKNIFKILCQEEAGHKLKLETMYDDFQAKLGD